MGANVHMCAHRVAGDRQAVGIVVAQGTPGSPFCPGPLEGLGSSRGKDFWGQRR